MTWETCSLSDGNLHRPLITLRFDFLLPFPPSPLPFRVSFVKKHKMYTTLISAAFFSLLAGRAVHANFSVQTPVFTQVNTSP